MSNLSLIICSSDKYSDCWDPFFTSLTQNFSEIRDHQIILNSEGIKYKLKDFDIHQNILTEAEIKKFGWGQRLRKNIELAESNNILLIMDDYFITQKVDYNKLSILISLMEKNEQIKNIRLISDSTNTTTSKYPELLEVKRFARYRFSLQAALWNKDFLLKLIEDHENPWQIESFGTKRSYFIKSGFYVSRQDILIYPAGGIIHKGKWIPEMIEIATKYNLSIDFKNRGFVKLQNRNTINRFKGKYNCYFKNPQSVLKSLYSIIKFPFKKNN